VARLLQFLYDIVTSAKVIRIIVCETDSSAFWDGNPVFGMRG